MISIGIGASQAHKAAPVTGGTYIDMPSLRNGADSKGATSVEISISGEARALLAVDTKSLAEKGYTSVDIDTDGKPGAEISIDLTNGNAPGVVVVGGSGTGPDLSNLLALLQQDSGEDGKSLQDLLLVTSTQSDEDGTAGPQNPALQLLLQVLQELNDALAVQSGQTPGKDLLAQVKEALASLNAAGATLEPAASDSGAGGSNASATPAGSQDAAVT